MNEITKIHLARTPFSIEIDAKKALEKYLAAIRKTMHADDETLNEIEARMVELLAERGVGPEQTITTTDIKELQARLGEPSEFVDESSADETAEAVSDKRLMRDEDSGWLGGVCAGIAAYYGINPLWVRLLAIISPFVSFGTAVIVYIVLWLAIPPARTAAEKLQMKGEPVTLAALKNAGEQVVEATRTAQKPLVVVLRTVLGVGFALAALAGLALLAMLVPLGIGGLEVSSLLRQSSWLLTAGVLGAAAIVLLVAIKLILSYMAFTWQASKRLITVVTFLMIGAALTGGLALGSGLYSAQQVNGQIEQMKQTDTFSLDLADVTQLTVDNPSAMLKYQVRPGQPRVSIRHIGASSEMRDFVKVERDGNTARLLVKPSHNCDTFSLNVSCVVMPEITVYGPELTSINIVSGTFDYRAITQAQLAVQVGRGGYFEVGSGEIQTLALQVDDNKCEKYFGGYSTVRLQGVENLEINGKPHALESIDTGCFSLSFM